MFVSLFLLSLFSLCTDCLTYILLNTSLTLKPQVEPSLVPYFTMFMMGGKDAVYNIKDMKSALGGADDLVDRLFKVLVYAGYFHC